VHLIKSYDINSRLEEILEADVEGWIVHGKIQAYPRLVHQKSISEA
jgi:hypothetical protein